MTMRQRVVSLRWFKNEPIEPWKSLHFAAIPLFTSALIIYIACALSASLSATFCATVDSYVLSVVDILSSPVSSHPCTNASIWKPILYLFFLLSFSLGPAHVLGTFIRQRTCRDVAKADLRNDIRVLSLYAVTVACLVIVASDVPLLRTDYHWGLAGFMMVTLVFWFAAVGVFAITSTIIGYVTWVLFG